MPRVKRLARLGKLAKPARLERVVWGFESLSGYGAQDECGACTPRA